MVAIVADGDTNGYALPKPIGDDDEESVSDTQELLEAQPLSLPSLSTKEKQNLVLLYFLYFIHALPLSFSWWTMPILLRQQLTYTDIGTFLVSQYPYSIKVLWSPIIDALHLPILGRRKTWVVPCFFVAGTVVFWLGLTQDRLVERIAAGETGAMAALVIAWLLLMFMGASIRIAIDGWALDLMSGPNVHWTTTIATLGELTATFSAFNLFLGLSSLGGRHQTGKKGEAVSTAFFYDSCGLIMIITALIVLVLKKEQGESAINLSKRSIRNSYLVIWKIITLPQVWTLMLIHMSSMIGFITNDSITVLQLVKEGYTDRDIAGLATVSFPFEIVFSILVSKTFDNQHPLRLWRKLFPYRLGAAIVAQLGVLLVTYYREHHWRWFISLIPYVLTKVLDGNMWVCLVAFHAQIADPRFGSIYLPLLATTLNVRYDSLGFLVTKTIGLLDGGEDLDKPTPLIDGYQIVNTLLVMIAIPVFWYFLRPATMYLQKVDPDAWRIKDDGVEHIVEYEMAPTRDITDELDDQEHHPHERQS